MLIVKFCIIFVKFVLYFVKLVKNGLGFGVKDSFSRKKWV